MQTRRPTVVRIRIIPARFSQRRHSWRLRCSLDSCRLSRPQQSRRFHVENVLRVQRWRQWMRGVTKRGFDTAEWPSLLSRRHHSRISIILALWSVCREVRRVKAWVTWSIWCGRRCGALGGVLEVLLADETVPFENVQLQVTDSLAKEFGRKMNRE